MKLAPITLLFFTISAYPMHTGDAITYAKIRLPEDLALTEQQALAISNEAPKNGALDEALILIHAPDGLFHYAKVLSPEWGNKNQLVYDFFIKQTVLCDIALTRILKVIPQILYQPRLPELLLRLFFQRLLVQVQHTSLPYLTARIIPANSVVSIIGDLHGHEGALRKIIQSIGKIKANRLLAFLGDYADRGPFGPEILCKLLHLIAEYQEQIELLRGNHETLSLAKSYDLFMQMQACAHLYDSNNESLLNSIFEALAQGLLLCIPPQDQEKNLPYHFLLLCHAGFDPSVPLKKYIINFIQQHKKTGESRGYYYFRHPYPNQTGYLWTDFRANRYQEEPATGEVSERSPNPNRFSLPNMYCFNHSAVQDFFDEHASEHPAHRFVLDGIIRGHWPLEAGIGRLNRVSDPDEDWTPLEDQQPEEIERGSVYTVLSSTKYTYHRGPQRVSYVDAGFSREKQQWTLTPHIFSKQRKLQSVPTPPPFDQENEGKGNSTFTFAESSK